MAIIYKITNNISNKSYIGQTKRTLAERWREHRKDKKRYSSHFSNAISKYPKESWKLEILEEISDVYLLNERECYWIEFYDSLKNGYNSISGGGQNTEFSKEAKFKMSKSQKGRKASEETKEKVRKSLSKIRQAS